MDENAIDKDNMLSILKKFPYMMEEVISLGDDITFPKEFIDNIVICGMGGSGFVGDLLKVYLSDLPLDILVVKDYNLPENVQRKSLVFAISYSGNTEETVSAYRSALRRGSRVIAISSGGKLEELSRMNKTPYIKVPKGIQPRISTPYLFIPILNVLSYSGIIEDQEKIIKRCIIGLENMAEKIENGSRDFASRVKDKIPIIYCSQRIFCIAEKWKTDINENAKTHAFYNVLPEFNHNEICAYENQRIDSHVIIISDKDDYQKIKDRIKIFKKLVSSYKVNVTEIGITGENFLTRLFSGIWMGLFFAYFLALEYKTDPTPVKIIEKLKKELA